MEYLYLAMTAAELQQAAPPGPVAYMACHFSPYGTALSNLPEELPPGSILMVNDRTPASGHDPELIAQVVHRVAEEVQAAAVVMDLQRPHSALCEEIARSCVKKLTLPVAVSELYAAALPCPVFLSAPALWTPMEEWLAPWEGREVWAEAALQQAVVTVTERGSVYEELPWEEAEDEWSLDEMVCTAYRIRRCENAVKVLLRRGKEELRAWMEQAEKAGVKRFLGLHQQMGGWEMHNA